MDKSAFQKEKPRSSRCWREAYLLPA